MSTQGQSLRIYQFLQRDSLVDLLFSMLILFLLIRMQLGIILSVTILWGQISSGQISSENSQTENNHPQMNGYSLKDFKEFEKKWKLVTVRYRKDSGEMRWTFANDKAWSTLDEGAIDYPDGAMFGKIAMATSEDSQFASSVVPTSTRRYLFMVRDKIKHADTGGWGYALFDSQGQLFPEEVPKATQACYACHKIVQNRGYVFSQPLSLATSIQNRFHTGSINQKSNSQTKSSTHSIEFAIQFRDEKIDVLNREVRKEMGPNWSRFRRIKSSDITKNLFQGTLDEIRPNLEIESKKTGLPSALLSDDLKRFSVLIPVADKNCNGTKFKALVSISKTNGGSEMKTFEYCSAN